MNSPRGFRLLRVGGIDSAAGEQQTAQMEVVDALAPSPDEQDEQLVFVDESQIRVSNRCSVTRRIALGRTGLGPRARSAERYYDCEVSAQTLRIRVRARVSSRGPFRRDGASLVLKRKISRAELSVRAPSGRLYGYMTMVGKDMRFWLARTCVRA